MTPEERPRLRIALATIEYPPDPFSAGIGSYTKSVAQLLASNGHIVHVVARGANGDEYALEEGVHVHRITPPRPQLPETLGVGQVAKLLARSLPRELRYRQKVVNTLDQLARNDGLDLTETADHMAEAVSFKPHRYPKVPFVVRLHTPLAFTEKIDPNIPELARLGMRTLERSLLRKATHITAPSEVAAKLILREMDVNRAVTVYPNPPTLDPATATGESITDPPIVLFIGRINLIKGPHLLAQAIPGVLSKVPDCRFIFVGADNVGANGWESTTDYLLSLMPSGCHASVRFIGHVPHAEIERYFREATLCVLPSLFESFGYTCLEAMGFGKAIVGSDCGGMAEMLDGGDAGLLFTPPNVQQLRDQIVRLLQDPHLRRRLGTRARERAASTYGRERVLAQVEEFYYRAVAEQRGRSN